MTSEITHLVRDGFEVVGLRNSAMELMMIPALGARIVSLHDRVGGREWIWQPAKRTLLRARPLGASFEDSGHTGIDECLPTIGACEWRGRALPDHGEAWSAVWMLDRPALARDALRTTLRLPVSPFDFERTLTLDGSRLHFSYALHNRGDATEPFLWSWHPLFGLHEGDRLELPAGVSEMRLEVALGASHGARGDRWTVPAAASGFDLGALTLGGNAGECVKGFIGPLTGGPTATARLRGVTGESLTVAWATAENPLLGIWLSRGYRGWHHVALEPTNGAPDRLDLAVSEWCSHGSLAAGQTLRWQLTVELGAG